MTSIAKLVSKTNLGNGFMNAEYAYTVDEVRGEVRIGGSGVVTCEGPHKIQWEWRATRDYPDYVGDWYDFKTTLLAAEHSPVSFHLTRTRDDGTTGQGKDFQLSRPGESRAEEFDYWGGTSMNYKVSFQYPVAEMPAALASPCSPLPSLQDDWRSMMLHGTFSDVTVTAGNKTFNLHKGVLASRSDVFDRMLKADMVESRSNKIDVDMDENIAEELFRFIYTGKVQGLEQIAAELLHVAVMYELATLKHMCLQELVKNVDEEKAANTLVIADGYSNDEEYKNYKNSILMYISRNYFTVVPTDGWRQLTVTNPELSLAATAFYVQQNS